MYELRHQVRLSRVTILRMTVAAAAATLLWASAATAQSASRDDHEQLVELKNDVQQLKEQQRQMLSLLEEMRAAAIKGNVAAQVINAPTEMSVAGEDFIGRPSASVVVIEYGDFQCPFCRRFAEDTLPQLRATYVATGKVRYYFRDMPLATHANAMIAARAARCANEQGQYWQMHDSLFSEQLALTQSGIDERATKLGLDVSKLNSCMASDRFVDSIQRSMQEANGMGIRGTPTFLIGTLDRDGKRLSVKKSISGAYPFDQFKEAIDPLIVLTDTSAAVSLSDGKPRVR